MESAIRIHYPEFIQCLNLEEIARHLPKNDILDSQDLVDEVDELLLNKHVPTRDKNKRLLEMLLERSRTAKRIFLECLREDDRHMGHDYLFSLLRDTFEPDSHCEISERLQKQLRKCRPELTRGIEVFTLSHYLYEAKLLTSSELKTLISTQSSMTQTEKVVYLLKILGTKGPKANYLFACCLKEEKEHRTHKELFELVTAGEDSSSFDLRFAIEMYEREVAVTKRVPDRISAEGTLISKLYFRKIRKLRRWHMDSSWDKADRKVKKFLKIDDKVLQIAITLENCTGYITRRNRDVVLLEVGKAMAMCEHCLPSTSNNVRFLQGRCHWVLAKLYRYTGEIDLALKHIQQAAEIHSVVECGEDAALTSYCHACILLERLSKQQQYSSSSPDEERTRALDYLERSISYASNEEYGLDLNHPRIRLAQLYLGSSPSRPGNIRDPKSISSAGSSLEAVKNFHKLGVRTQCIYYFTKSDLVYHTSVGRARCYAQLALDIARESGCKTEELSAQARLDRIDKST